MKLYDPSGLSEWNGCLLTDRLEIDRTFTFDSEAKRDTYIESAGTFMHVPGLAVFVTEVGSDAVNVNIRTQPQKIHTEILIEMAKSFEEVYEDVREGRVAEFSAA